MSSEKSKIYFGAVQHGKIALFASFAAKVDKITEILINQTEIEETAKMKPTKMEFEGEPTFF